VAAAVAAVVLAGCGGVKPVPVRGVATVNGQPLPFGQVLFQPTDPQAGRPALGKIETDGRFEATSFAPGDGLMPGEYRLAIDPARPEFDTSVAHLTAPPVHPKYADGGTSGLTVTVRQGDGAHWLELKLDPK
jgi:hypothetical protein